MAIIPHVERGRVIDAATQNELIDQVNANTNAIAAGGGGGGVTDHGFLTGLADDDHPQYHTDARGDARYSPLAHNHDTDYSPMGHTHDSRYYTEAEVNTALAGKSDTTHTHPYAPESHTHAIADIQATGTPDNTVFLRGDGTWSVPSGAGGTSDHGSLTGLADDDHPQYHNDVRGDARYSQLGHTHDEYLTPVEGDAAYSAVGHTHDYAASTHNHDTVYYTETEVDTALAGKAAAVHSHAIADVTNLQTSLDGKAASTHNHDSAYADIGHNHDTAYAASAHTHSGYMASGDVNTIDVVTQAEYDGLTTPDPGTLYVITGDAVTVQNLGLTGTIDANLYNAANLDMTGDATLNVPTGGKDMLDIQVVAYANGADRTLTIAAGYARLDGINTSYVVPAGKKLRIGLRRSDLGTVTWIVEAVGVTQ